MSTAAFRRLKALVVEDNPHMRVLLRDLLLSLGIGQVLEAADGRAAMEALKTGKIDFILTDLSMKPVDGIAFTKMVRRSKSSPNPFVPVIMITGHTERARVEAARDAGVTEVLAKPVTAKDLLRRIAEIVERPRTFVCSDGFTGPNRRRRKDPGHRAPLRRQEDLENLVIV